LPKANYSNPWFTKEPGTVKKIPFPNNLSKKASKPQLHFDYNSDIEDSSSSDNEIKSVSTQTPNIIARQEYLRFDYIVRGDKHTMASARNECQKWGGNLASISNKKEAKFIYNMLGKSN